MSIQKYLDSLPNDTKDIRINNLNLQTFPNLSRFFNLKILDCSNNQFKFLPELSSNIIALNCSDNQLTSLPELPSKLVILNCCNNKLILLPNLPLKLLALNCQNNQLIYNKNKKQCINQKNIQIQEIKHKIFCLKYKKHFRKWLWENVREKKIKLEMHPNRILELLEEKDINEILF